MAHYFRYFRVRKILSLLYFSLKFSVAKLLGKAFGIWCEYKIRFSWIIQSIQTLNTAIYPLLLFKLIVKRVGQKVTLSNLQSD